METNPKSVRVVAASEEQTEASPLLASEVTYTTDLSTKDGGDGHGTDRRAALGKLRGSVKPSFRRRNSSRLGGSHELPPSAALVSLISGGKLPKGALSKPDPHPPPRVKTLPPRAPYRRRARHRSFRLRWINEFRHWWKSSRLLVRLAGLYQITRLNWTEAISKSSSITGLDLARKKGPKIGLRLVKLLGHGGVMRGFLKTVQPFTRLVRIVVAVWRWIEAAPCRRLEVGVEEATAFVGNRCSRIFSRYLVDILCLEVIFPIVHDLLRRGVWWWNRDTYNPAHLIIILGIIRAVAPYAASFQGSRVARIFTRNLFSNGMFRWRPVQSISELNLNSEDCHEGDEIQEDADLLPLARRIAAAVGKADDDHQVRMALEDPDVGFHMVGCGAGGLSVYECPFHKDTGSALLLHITPYGPSIMDILPQYIVLEKEESADIRKYWSQSVAKLKWASAVGPPVLEGFLYQGAYFSPHHFAELRERYDGVMMEYALACKYMSKRRQKGISNEFASPPTDLDSLKRFIETGTRGRDQRRTRNRKEQTRRMVLHLAKKIKTMMDERKGGKDEAPKGVILYFEGLDCAGKSSTGNLIRDALLEAGYEVDMRQYNRPPTPEQRQKPWMDRFDVPGQSEGTPYDSIKDDDEEQPETTTGSLQKKPHNPHQALIWDRGPAGDFVYGSLAFAPEGTKQKRYQEFLDFDLACRENNILFFKLLFVTDRDAVARTLGKRLAHKKICQDLHIWLDASCGGHVHEREGLDEIDLHIDPTDFVAFNSYHENLHKFVNFAKNTDIRVDKDGKKSSGYQNQWVVVSTTRRHPARLALINAFERQLETFHQGWCRAVCGCKPKVRKLHMGTGRVKGVVLALVYLVGIGILYWYYIANTYNHED